MNATFIRDHYPDCAALTKPYGRAVAALFGTSPDLSNVERVEHYECTRRDRRRVQCMKAEGHSLDYIARRMGWGRSKVYAVLKGGA